MLEINDRKGAARLMSFNIQPINVRVREDARNGKTYVTLNFETSATSYIDALYQMFKRPRRRPFLIAETRGGSYLIGVFFEMECIREVSQAIIRRSLGLSDEAFAALQPNEVEFQYMAYRKVTEEDYWAAKAAGNNLVVELVINAGRDERLVVGTLEMDGVPSAVIPPPPTAAEVERGWLEPWWAPRS